jgi:hypothetical protein
MIMVAKVIQFSVKHFLRANSGVWVWPVERAQPDCPVVTKPWT